MVDDDYDGEEQNVLSYLYLKGKVFTIRPLLVY